jgi:hypothetical protein
LKIKNLVLTLGFQGNKQQKSSQAHGPKLKNLIETLSRVIVGYGNLDKYT